MKKLIFILILSSIVCVNSYSQALNNKDSVIDEKITKNKYLPISQNHEYIFYADERPARIEKSKNKYILEEVQLWGIRDALY